MHIPIASLKQLNTVPLTAEETILLKWLRGAVWEVVKEAKEPAFKAKVPEFFGGVRLYRMQTGGAGAGSLGALELFIKKLGLQGIISKQELYPLTGHSNQPRYLVMKKTDLENLGVGKTEDTE